MLVMMKLERFRRHIRRERVIGIGKFRKCESHGILLALIRGYKLLTLKLDYLFRFSKTYLFRWTGPLFLIAVKRSGRMTPTGSCFRCSRRRKRAKRSGHFSPSTMKSPK